MASSGQTTPLNAPSVLTGMGDNPSVNSRGTVAFVGQFAGGEGVIVADPFSTAKLISFPPNPLRFFGRAVQINDLGQVVATDRFSGSPPSFFGRLWDSSTGAFNTLLRGNGTAAFAAVLGQASVNNKNDAVFGALDPTATQILLVSVQSNGTISQNAMPANSLPRPQISDNGNVVVRFGNQANSPILLYSIDFSQVSAIASTADSAGVRESRKAITMESETQVSTHLKVANKARQNPRGVFKKIPGSGEWCVRYTDASGRYRREKAGSKRVAIKLVDKRRTEALQGKKLPDNAAPPHRALWRVGG
jgi:hypothetical protein